MLTQNLENPNQFLSKITIHPFLFGIFPIVSLFYSNIQILFITEIIFPLIFVLGIIGGIWFLLKIILKDKIKSAFIVSLFLIIFFSYGHAYLEFDHFTINDIDIGKHRFFLIPFLTILLIGTLFLIKTKKKLNNATTITNTISLALVIIVSINIGVYYLENSSVFNFEQETNEINSMGDAEYFPNIYYIILDAYPGYHSLKKISNYDNDEFYNYFQKKGFFTSKNSFTNYLVTELSIPSALNMEYLHLSLDLKDNSFDANTLHVMGNENKIMMFLQSIGYTTINFDSGWGFSRDMRYADLQLCGDNEFMDSEFIIMLTKTSMLNPIYVKIYETNKTEMKLCTFDKLPTVPSLVNEPFFVFAHILLPHGPFLFGPNGEILSPDDLDLDNTSPEYQSAFLDQVTFTNKKIIKVVNQLLDSENPPVIIIQSDHGSSFTFKNPQNGNYPDADMLLEKMNNINFIYLPSNSTNIIHDTITPVNTFRVIFNHYFKTDLETLEDNSYIFNGDGFDDITDRLHNITQ